MLIEQALQYLGFLFLDEKKELHRNHFKSCNTQTHLKFCNRVLILQPLASDDLREIKEFYGEYPYTYWLLSTNPEISSWLQNSNLKKLTQFPLLSLSTENKFVQPEINDLEIIEVTGKNNILSKWAPLCAEGYQINEEAFQRFIDYLIHSSAYPAMHFYSVIYEGKPAATCMWIDRKTMADMHWICTLPAFRTKGIGRYITCYALNKINKNKEAILYSSPAGYPLYTSIGFKEQAIVSVYK